MWSTLKFYDIQLFDLINHLPHSYWSDSFFAFFSGLEWYRFVWIFIFLALFLYKLKNDKLESFALFLSLVFTFLFVSFGLKNLIHRPRPEFFLSTHAILPWDFADTWSFPSTHATLAFALAVILSKKHTLHKLLFYITALLIAFSRIYLGKHFPSDVLIGSITGMVIGSVSFSLSKRIFVSENQKKRVKK